MTAWTSGDRHGARQWQDELNQLLESLSHMDLTNDIFEQTEYLQAHGGFCDVFKAKSKRYGNMTVAVKRLRIHILDEKTVSKTIFKELKIWSSLSHSNVLPLLGYVMHDKYPAFISEWMVNHTVLKYMETHSEIRILPMARGIAEGLKYLHERDVIHSDLKPDNILISNFGEPLLADFGISRLVTTMTSTGSATGPKGNVRYMAIELLSDNPSFHTKASDIWAYGMLVYALLTGSAPFSALKFDLIVLKTIVDGQTPSIMPWKSLDAARKADHDMLWELCQKCWERTPCNRPTMAFISDTFAMFSRSVTLRISGIPESATEDDLIRYFQSKGLLLSEDHSRIQFTKTKEGFCAIVSFFDVGTCKRALSLPRGERKLKDSTLAFDDEFLRITALSDGTQLDIGALHGMNGHDLETAEPRSRFPSPSTVVPPPSVAATARTLNIDEATTKGNRLGIAMATTARITRIENLTTVKDLEEYFEHKGLSLRPGHRSISLARGEFDCKTATVSFFDNATLKKALDLPKRDIVLRNCTFDIDDEFDGFTVLSEGAQADIVAIHAMNGHAFNSWEFKDNSDGRTFMWLRDCLPERIPDARIMVYGHGGNIICDVSLDQLHDLADKFLEGLLRIRNWNLTTDRPLVLLAHSMGGLIIKEALIIASTRKDGRYRSILNSVRGAIFFGTPHRDAYILKAGGFLAPLTRFFDNNARANIKSLKLDLQTKVISELTQDFQTLVAATGIGICSVFETKKTKVGFFKYLLVGEQAATLGVIGERKIRIDIDHMNMCRFKNAGDASLSAIIETIEEFGANFPSKPVIPPRLAPEHRAVSDGNDQTPYFSQDLLPRPGMAATARVSNIENSTTENDLTNFLQSKGLLLSIGHRISFTPTESGHKLATVSFFDEEICRKAVSLPRGESKLKGRTLDFNDKFDGFTVLSRGASSQVDIVALHGMNGHAFKSFEYRDSGGFGFMWLRDCLPERVPNARIMVYGYNANVSEDASTGRIRTFAETFLENLLHVRRTNEVKDRPLILLGHSLGGLIIKQALLIAQNRADDRFDSILNSVCGVLFIGTPHRGLNGVDEATFLANFLRVFNVDIRSDLLAEQRPCSTVLFDLTEDFKQLIAAKNIEVATLFETEKTKFKDASSIWIVDEQSAILGVARERKAAIDTNHLNLCKFDNAEDNSLTMVIDYIKEFHDSFKFKCPADPDKAGVEGSYPVLLVGEYYYYALTYFDDREAVAVVAFDKNGKERAKWSKPGARYVQRIEYCELEGSRQISFMGEGGRKVFFHLAELKVEGPL